MHNPHPSGLQVPPQADTADALSFRQEQLECLAREIEDRQSMNPILQAMSKDTGLTLKNLWQRDFLAAAKLLRRFQTQQHYRVKDGFDPAKREPLGTIACILPGNGALNILCKVLAAASLAGNRSHFRLPTRFKLAGPKISGLIQRHLNNVKVEYSPIRGENATFLKNCLHNPNIRAVVIFGSDSWIRPFKSLAMETGTKLIFEGPGNDPAVVFPDASPALAAEEILKNALTNGGQSCSAIKRIYVHHNILSPFLKELLKRIPEFVFGLPQFENVTIGPTQGTNLRKRIAEQMKDAKAGGAEFLYGNGTLDENHVFRPTILLAKPAMDVVVNETFYSVLPLVPFHSEAQAKCYVDGTTYGLNASFFGTPSPDFVRFLYTTHKTLCVNSTITHPQNINQAMLTGGFKNSGFISEWRREGDVSSRVPVPNAIASKVDRQYLERTYLTRQGRFFLRPELSRGSYPNPCSGFNL